MIARADETGRRAGIIVVSSVVAFQPMPYFATYAATKAFDLLFAEALAGELNGKSIDVLAVCPGATRTEFFRRAGRDLCEKTNPGARDLSVVKVFTSYDPWRPPKRRKIETKKSANFERTFTHRGWLRSA